MMDHEKLSAWIDGELEPDQARGAPVNVLADPELARRWQDWHLVGDVMRSSSLAIASSAVSRKVSEQLASEPLHFLPTDSQQSVRAQARNRSRLVYGGAIAAAIAFVSLVTLAPQMQTNFGELVASAVPGMNPAVVAQPLEPVMLADPRVSELMEAHGSMSIRTVSEVR